MERWKKILDVVLLQWARHWIYVPGSNFHTEVYFVPRQPGVFCILCHCSDVAVFRCRKFFLIASAVTAINHAGGTVRYFYTSYHLLLFSLSPASAADQCVVHVKGSAIHTNHFLTRIFDGHALSVGFKGFVWCRGNTFTLGLGY